MDYIAQAKQLLGLDPKKPPPQMLADNSGPPQGPEQDTEGLQDQLDSQAAELEDQKAASQQQLNQQNAAQPSPETQDPASMAGAQASQAGTKSPKDPNFVGRAMDVTDMRKGLEDYLKQPSQMDLSPLMALADQWSGSKLASGYKSPASPEDRQKMIAGLQGQLSKEETGLSEDQIKYMAAKAKSEALASKSGAGGLSPNQQALAAFRDKRLLNNQANLLRRAISVDGNKKIGDEQNRIDATQRIHDLADSVDPVTHNLNPTAMTTFAADYQQILGSATSHAASVLHSLTPPGIGNDVAKIEEWLTNGPVNTGQHEFVDQMLKTADEIAFNANERKNREAWKHLSEGSRILKEGGALGQGLYSDLVKGANLNPSDLDKNGVYIMKKSPAALAAEKLKQNIVDKEKGDATPKDTSAKDPDTVKYSTLHNLSYDDAAKILASRSKNAGLLPANP